MKKKIIFFFTITLLLILTACGEDTDSNNDEDTNSNNDEEITFKFNANFSEEEMEENPYLNSLKQFKDEVEEESNGLLQIDVFFNGELGKSTSEVVGGAQSGSFEMFNLVGASWSEYTDAFLPFNVPFLFSSAEVVEGVINGSQGEKIKEKVLDETDIRVVYIKDQGPKNITNNKRPIHSPDDMEGLKVRVLDNDYAIEMYQSMGASTESVSYSEIYTSAQQGLIDGIEVSSPDAINSKLNEVQDYISIIETIYSPVVVGVSEEAYQSLSDDLKGIFDTAAENAQQSTQEIADFEDEILEELKKEMEVNELTDEEFELFVNKTKPIREKAEKDMGEEDWNNFIQAVEEEEDK